MHFSISPIRATCLAKFVIRSKTILKYYVMSKNNESTSDIQMVFPASCYEVSCVILLSLSSVLNVITTWIICYIYMKQLLIL
jgi:hypothetical protein